MHANQNLKQGRKKDNFMLLNAAQAVDLDLPNATPTPPSQHSQAGSVIADEVHSTEINTSAVMWQCNQFSNMGFYHLAPGIKEQWMCSGNVCEWNRYYSYHICFSLICYEQTFFTQLCFFFFTLKTSQQQIWACLVCSAQSQITTTHAKPIQYSIIHQQLTQKCSWQGLIRPFLYVLIILYLAGTLHSLLLACLLIY